MTVIRRWALSLLAVGLGVAWAGPSAQAVSPPVDDPIFTQGLQWGLEQIHAPDGWATATGEGITIAIIDSGVDLTHEDLRSKLTAQANCVGSQGDSARCTGSAQDDHGHGTHVAGIALASTNNGVGMAGVAPNAQLMAVRVLSNQCGDAAPACDATGTSEDVSAGIRWATDHGADIINLSLGGGAEQSAMGCSFCEAIDYAWSKDVIVVLAAGNDSVLPDSFSTKPVIIVSATNRADAPASYSRNRTTFLASARWAVAAPGGEDDAPGPTDCSTDGNPQGIISAYWVPKESNRYACVAGTSMASAHTAGALAVLLSTGLTPEAAIDRLLATADDLGTPGRDDDYGVGRINLAAAVDPAVPGVADPGPTSREETLAVVATSTGADNLTTAEIRAILAILLATAGATALGASQLVKRQYS